MHNEDFMVLSRDRPVALETLGWWLIGIWQEYSERTLEETPVFSGSGTLAMPVLMQRIETHKQ